MNTQAGECDRVKASWGKVGDALVRPESDQRRTDVVEDNDVDVVAVVSNCFFVSVSAAMTRPLSVMFRRKGFQR
ncbi:hypothetical protein ColTof4_02977 [Colletotrichum tofieldiae]|nr:hypothetical protein ColTof3_13618 [Colletotrichum tofieldiae]GKT70554.1 hypothetical protein ColTof4_02977 [Colletotrichum tofieldiae]